MTTGAIYARVSTPGQREEGTSLETQVRECISFAEHKGLDIPPHLVFQEQASGADRWFCTLDGMVAGVHE